MIIKLLWTYLHHDVEQLTHRYSSVRFAENAELENEGSLGADLSDMQLIMRYCLTGVAHLHRILKDYVERSSNDANDALGKHDEWTFQFKEELFDSQALASIMHWFIVKWCVHQWALAYSPNDASLAKKDLDDTKNELNDWLDDAMPIKERRPVYDESDIVVTYDPEYEPTRG